MRVKGGGRRSVGVVEGGLVAAPGCSSWRRSAICSDSCCQFRHRSGRGSRHGHAGLRKYLLGASKAQLSKLATYPRVSRTGRCRAVVRLCGTKLNAPTACVLAAPGLRFASDLLVSRAGAAAVALRRRQRQRQRWLAAAAAASSGVRGESSSCQRARHDHTLNPKPCLLCARSVQLVAVR